MHATRTQGVFLTYLFIRTVQITQCEGDFATKARLTSCLVGTLLLNVDASLFAWFTNDLFVGAADGASGRKCQCCTALGKHSTVSAKTQQERHAVIGDRNTNTDNYFYHCPIVVSAVLLKFVGLCMHVHLRKNHCTS